MENRNPIYRSLVLRLTAWFLFLSTVPLAVMAVFVRRNVSQVFFGLVERRQSEELRMLSLHLEQLPTLEAKQDLLTNLSDDFRQTYLVDLTGTILYHPQQTFIGQHLQDFYNQGTVTDLLVGDSKFVIDARSNQFVNSIEIEDQPYLAVLSVRQDRVRQSLDELERTSSVQLAVSLLLVSITGGAAIWLVIGAPIRKLTQAAHRLGSGELSVRVEPEEMEDELEVLALSFNRMAAQLQSLFTGLENTVTELRAAEHNLQASERRFRALIENSADGIALVDHQGTLLYSGGPVVEMLGYEPRDLINKSILDFVHPDDRQENLEKLARLVGLPGGHDSSQIRILNSEGSYRWLEITASNSLGDPSVGGMVLNYRDVTDRKLAELERENQVLRMEQQQQALIMLSTDEALLVGDFDRTAVTLTEVVAQALKTEKVSVWLLDEDPGWMACRSSYLRSIGVHESGRRVAVHHIRSLLEALENQRVFTVEEARLDSRLEYLLANRVLPEDITSLIETGIWLHGRLMGLLSIGAVGRVRRWQPDEAAFAAAVADQATVALLNQERRKVEQARRETAEKLRAIFESVSDGLALVSTQGVILDCNPAMARLYGYERLEDLIGLSEQDFLAPEKRQPEAKPIEAAAVQENSGLREHRLKRRDGQYFDAEISSVLLRDGEGEVTGLVALVRDVSERKQAERERERLLAQVRAYAAQVEHIMNTVPEGLLLLDAEGRVRLANPAAADDLPEIALGGLNEPLQRLGNRPLAELLLKPVQGSWHEVQSGERFFEVAARPIGASQVPEGWVVVVRDATQERNIQRRVQQQERLAAVGQLAAGIAHDFNNIMAVILLYSEMILSMPNLEGPVRERLQTISQQAYRAADLIQQILDFSRRSILERTAMNIVPVFKEQVKLLRRTLPENVTLNFQCSSDIFTVLADPTRIQQTIMNLAVNARDAMPEGGRLAINLTRLEEDEKLYCVSCGELSGGDWLKIEFRDTGLGIPAHLLPRIFEPFFTTKSPGQGTGLGLSQVYGIVKQHEGHINVDTSQDQGACFTIYLPLIEEHTLRARTKSRPAFQRGAGETILVVEDDPITRQALLDSLSLLTYRTLPATNGKEALSILEEMSNEVSLILTDVVMPEMGGLALFEELQSRGYLQPVIMLTGHPMHQQLERLKERGLFSWLQKPVSLERLAEEISQALNQE